MLTGATKTVLETSDEAGVNHHLVLQGDTLLLQEKVDDYDVSKAPGENPETMKEAAKSQENSNDLMGTWDLNYIRI